MITMKSKIHQKRKYIVFTIFIMIFLISCSTSDRKFFVKSNLSKSVEENIRQAEESIIEILSLLEQASSLKIDLINYTTQLNIQNDKLEIAKNLIHTNETLALEIAYEVYETVETLKLLLMDDIDEKAKQLDIRLGINIFLIILLFTSICVIIIYLFKNYDVPLDKTKLVAIIITMIACSAIFITIIYLPNKSSFNFSELIIFEYDNNVEEFQVFNYTTTLEINETKQIYFIVKNFNSKVIYYQVRIKISNLILRNHTTEDLSFVYLYDVNTFKTFLIPDTDITVPNSKIASTEKNKWGPISTTLFISEENFMFFGNETTLFFIFEIWTFNTNISDFTSTDIFVVLPVNIAVLEGLM